LIDDLITVADFERAAAAKLEDGVAGYFFGGAGDELTLALCGCPSPAELDRTHLRRAPGSSVYSA
jgi:hypothetical protein